MMNTMTLVWVLVFLLALFTLVKGSGWLLKSSERIGLAFGLSPFIVGVTLVAIGTSLPELTASIFAVVGGATDVPVANAVGSNIANILVVIGVLVLVSRRILVKRSLIDIDLPLLAIVTALFLLIAWDGTISTGEALLLLASYGIYLGYTLVHVDEKRETAVEATLPLKKKHKQPRWWWPFDQPKDEIVLPKIRSQDVMMFAAGIVALPLGAKYTIEAAVNISAELNIATGLIALLAIALGTSLPEIFVSVDAARKGKADVALGNIIGSCVFNVLVVVGATGVLTNLSIDGRTLAIGLPFLAVSTLLFVIVGITKHIHVWEGTMFLLLYIYFVGRVTNLL